MVVDTGLAVIFKRGKILYFEFKPEEIEVEKIFSPKKQYSRKESERLNRVIMEGNNFGESGLKNIVNIIRPRTFGENEKIESNRYYNLLPF